MCWWSGGGLDSPKGSDSRTFIEAIAGAKIRLKVRSYILLYALYSVFFFFLFLQTNVPCCFNFMLCLRVTKHTQCTPTFL